MALQGVGVEEQVLVAVAALLGIIDLEEVAHMETAHAVVVTSEDGGVLSMVAEVTAMVTQVNRGGKMFNSSVCSPTNAIIKILCRRSEIACLAPIIIDLC